MASLRTAPFSSPVPARIPIEPTPTQLIMGSKRIQGWASGTATDSEGTLRFAEYTGVRPMIEKFPLDQVNEASNRMIGGKARFRGVLTMEGLLVSNSLLVLSR